MPTDDESSSGAIIIELPSIRERPLLSHEKERPARAGCYVHTFRLDDDKRTVHCRQCGAVFEAFDALVEIAKAWESYGRQLRAYDAEIKRLQTKQDDLKRDVTNLKAQRRRHAERLASVDVPVRCPAINIDKRQCTLPAGHDAGAIPTEHYEPRCNYGWMMPKRR